MSERQATDPARPGGPGRPRPRFTSRAAVLVVVVCAIALSVAYPVREYLAQLRQISQLQAQQTQISAQLRRLRTEHRKLSSNAYVEQQARERLGMCFPTQTCYVIIGRKKHTTATAARPATVVPWYERLWSSVQDADHIQQADPQASKKAGS